MWLRTSLAEVSNLHGTDCEAQEFFFITRDSLQLVSSWKRVSRAWEAARFPFKQQMPLRLMAFWSGKREQLQCWPAGLNMTENRVTFGQVMTIFQVLDSPNWPPDMLPSSCLKAMQQGIGTVGNLRSLAECQAWATCIRSASSIVTWSSRMCHMSSKWANECSERRHFQKGTRTITTSIDYVTLHSVLRLLVRTYAYPGPQEKNFPMPSEVHDVAVSALSFQQGTCLTSLIVFVFEVTWHTCLWPNLCASPIQIHTNTTSISLSENINWSKIRDDANLIWNSEIML